MARLKVFRTPIGFHDAYVAAPSQKAALEAWGADKNLFASGRAEVVTDPKLIAEPLASPGKIVRRTRGSLRDHLDAAGKQSAPAAKRPAAEAKPPSSAPRRAKPKPRPSRAKLDEAEHALAALQAKIDAERAEQEAREAALQKARETMEARHRKAVEKLEVRLDRVRKQYDAALGRWRASD